MRCHRFLLVPMLCILPLLVSCGLPMGANYSDYSISADAVTAAEPYGSTPAESVPLPETPPPEEQPVLRITKDPTDETVSPGGSAWFVAKAENAFGIRWELIDTYGTVCSPEEAKLRNPGLDTVETGSDAISLGNVPLTMDGWHIRAVFEDEEETLMTASALLTVIDREDPYSCIRMRYTKAFAFGRPSAEYCHANGLSEQAASCDGVSGAFYDFDENGTAELLLVGSFYEENNAPRSMLIQELYTVTDCAPYRVFCAGPSTELYWIGENRFLLISGGTGFRSYGIYHLANDFLLYDEVWLAEWDQADPSVKTWTHRVDNSIGYSDDTPQNAEDAAQALEQLYSLICLPPLSPIT